MDVRLLSVRIPAFDTTDPYAADVVDVRMTSAEHAQYKDALVEKKAAFSARMQAQSARAAAAGTDRDTLVVTDPGAVDLAASLQSVTAAWPHVRASDLRVYYSTGQAPLDLDAAQLTAYTEDATRSDDAVKRDPQLLALIGTLPAHARAQFQAQWCVSRVGALVPCLWLRDKMRLLCVRTELAEKTLFLIERHATQSREDVQWCRAVQLHNGFCKTVLELQAFHRTA
jgi:hypothetical protein